MEESKHIEPEYLKGFNQGYTIAKFKPELIESLIKADEKSLQGQGMADGYKEFLLEKVKHKEVVPSKSNNADKEKGKEIEKDRD